MSATPGRRSVVVPEFWNHPGEHARKIALAVNAIQTGQTNNHFALTLDPDATSTEILFTSVRVGTSAFLFPKTPQAAEALRTTDIWAIGETGKVVIHHDSASDSDRTFGCILIG